MPKERVDGQSRGSTLLTLQPETKPSCWQGRATLGLCRQLHTGRRAVTSWWLHVPHAVGAQEGNSEPPFSRDTNPEDRRLILEIGNKILERAEMGGDQGVPGCACGKGKAQKARSPESRCRASGCEGQPRAPTGAAASPVPLSQPRPHPSSYLVGTCRGCGCGCGCTRWW